MWKAVRSEWMKIKRCQILLVGIVALGICPVVQYGSWLIMAPELRDPNYNMESLFANVMWGNTQIFLPLSLVMIGGWLIDRETVNDTMKNLRTVPVNFPVLLGAKLIVTAVLAVLFGMYSTAVTVLTGAVSGLDKMTADVLVPCAFQLIGAAVTTYLVCMPVILLFGQIRGAYLGGAVITFVFAYCMLFFKGGVLLSAYPFSAALILVSFDMEKFNGAVESPNPLLSLLGIGIMVLLTAALLVTARPGKETKRKERKRGGCARGRAVR